MQIFISKNNQQLGPFDEATVLEALKTGRFSPQDTAIREGEKNWSTLSALFPNASLNALPATTTTTTAPPPKKSRKTLLMGCGGITVVLMLISGILGFLAYRNKFPATNQEDLPDSINGWRLKTGKASGDIWGREILHTGVYEGAGGKQSILYLATTYANETAAQANFKLNLYKSCKNMNWIDFSFRDAGGEEKSKGATCGGAFYVIKQNKVVGIGEIDSNASPDDVVENITAFAENLPFNKGTKIYRK